MINLTIDGVQIEAKEGQSILSAAREHGIHIPTLCFLEKINEIGSCRICVVEVEGMNKLVTACNTKVKAGMNITTDSPAVIESRKNTLHLLMAEHKTNCFKCIKNGACELQARHANMVLMCQTLNHHTEMYSMSHLTLIHSSPTTRVFVSSASVVSALVQKRPEDMLFLLRETVHVYM